MNSAVPVAIGHIAASALGWTGVVEPQMALLASAVLSVTTVARLAATRRRGDYMRSDLRAEWRTARQHITESSADDSGRSPVVFSGTVHTVIVSQTISADTVHIAAQPLEPEPVRHAA